MTYQEWIDQVPDSIKNDSLWKFQAYPKALFLFDLAWEDSGKMMKDLRGRKIAGQLIDSAGSVSANIEEGFGRGFGRDYARFLKISLGSARESRGWYYRGRKLLPENVLQYRYKLIEEIISLLIVNIPKQRNYKPKDD